MLEGRTGNAGENAPSGGSCHGFDGATIIPRAASRQQLGGSRFFACSQSARTTTRRSGNWPRPFPGRSTSAANSRQSPAFSSADCRQIIRLRSLLNQKPI